MASNRTPKQKAPFFSIPAALVFLFVVLFTFGYAPQTQAASICQDSAGNDVQGFTTAIVFCVRSSINDAIAGTHITNIISAGQKGYLTQVIDFLTPYKWAAIVLALTLYGVKLMTVSVEELLKESSFLLFRIAFVLFLIDNLGTAAQTTLYSSATGNGLYGAATDFAGELVSFISVGFAKVTQGCPVPPLPVGANPSEYAVWQGFDCIFNHMIGGTAGGKGTTPAIVAIIGAAFWSGIFGVAVGIAVITLYIACLLALLRAVYSVILAYFVLGLLMVVGPLIIPALVFDSKFTKDLFWKWISLIISTMLQPLFVIGFLSFFLLVQYQFVNGDFPPYTFSDGTKTSCVMGEYTNDDNGINLGGGSGVCSFHQLLTQSNNGKGCGPDGQQCISMQRIFTITFNVGIPQIDTRKCPDWFKWGCTAIDATLTGILTVVNWGLDVVEMVLNFFIGIMFSVGKLSHFPLQQFFVSACAFLIISFVMMDLMKTMPHLAEQMTLSVGLGLLRMAQVPLESVIARATKSFGDAAAAGGRAGNFGMIFRGGKATGDSLLNSLVGKRK